MTRYLFIVFFTLFATLSGCKPINDQSQVKKNTLVDAACIESLKPCTINKEHGQFAIAVNTKRIITEQPFDLVLSYQGQRKITKVSGFLAGKTMYMGKIPLFFNAAEKPGSFVSQTMLGMCSERSMIWQMTLNVEYQASSGIEAKVETLLFEFQSTND